MSAAEFLRPGGWLSEDGGPRYVQLRRRLKEAIDVGMLPPGAPLPPERELAGITDLSRVTVRKAIRDLAREGLVERRQGSGTFVRQPVARMAQSLSRLTSFTEQMAQRGLDATSRWLERGVFAPTQAEAAALGLGAGDEVARIGRLRMAGGRPMALERASLPLDILPNPLAVKTSLYAVLAELGTRPVRAVQKISAVNIDAPEARLLGVAEGAAGLSIERTSCLESGRVAEFTRSLYRGDAYDFVAELRL